MRLELRATAIACAGLVLAVASACEDGSGGDDRGDDELAQSTEFLPGVLLDADRANLFAMMPKGGVTSISVATGRTAWENAEAAVPVALWGEHWIARAEPREAGLFELLVLERSSGATVRRSEAKLPEGVLPVVGRRGSAEFTLESASFDPSRAAMEESDGAEEVTTVERGLALRWTFVERAVTSMPEDGPPATRSASGGLLFLPDEGRFEPLPLADFPVTLLPQLTGDVQGRLKSGELELPLWRSGQVLAGILRSPTDGSVRLGRFDVESGRSLSLHSWRKPLVAYGAAADQRHLLVSTTAGEPRSLPYDWTVLDIESGDRVASLRRRAVPSAWFLIAGERLLLEAPAGGGLPRRVLALDLATGEERWSLPIRDPEAAAPLPPGEVAAPPSAGGD